MPDLRVFAVWAKEDFAEADGHILYRCESLAIGRDDFPAAYGLTASETE